MITVRAFAKINLDLRIVGTRPDGYHDLRTVFQSIALHDTLTLVARKGSFALRCDMPGVPLDNANLVWRGAASLWSALERRGELGDLSISIDKRIPLQAGLGGGSADAAAALLALTRLWGRPLELPRLRAVASHLGADVPFFLCGGTALGLDLGNEVYPLADLAPHWVVLVLPAFGVSTTEAYRWYDEARAAGRRDTGDWQVLPGFWPPAGMPVRNDLETAVARRHPEILGIKAALRTGGAVVSAMSGSGSAVFGMFEDRRAAGAAERRMRRLGWRTILTRTLGRGEYARRVRPLPAGRRRKSGR